MKERHAKKAVVRKPRPRRTAAARTAEEDDDTGSPILEDVDSDDKDVEEVADELTEQSERSLNDSTEKSDSMGQSGSFGSSSTKSSEKRRTLHTDMLELRSAMMAKEKEVLEADMKAKLRKHRERYKKTMSQRKDEVKRLLPCNPNFLR